MTVAVLVTLVGATAIVPSGWSLFASPRMALINDDFPLLETPVIAKIKMNVV